MKFFTLTVFICLFSAVFSQTHQGNAVLTTQAELENFNYTHVEGTLTISGTNITTLLPLLSLQSVNRLELSGLDISNFWGLLNLEINEALTVVGNQNLVDLSQLANINSGPGHSIAIIISNNQNLLEIVGFNNLTDASSIKITSNAALEEISGFNGLTDCGEIDIADNFNLNFVEGFESVQSPIVNFNLNNNFELHKISGFNLLTEVDSLMIYNNLELDSIYGFGSMHFCQSCTFQSNTQLKFLGSFEDINGFGSFNLDGSSIEEISFHSSVIDVLAVENNPSLTSIDFIDVQNITSELKINNNQNLVDLNNLLLSEVNTLIVTNNPNLSDCSEICQEVFELANTTTIENNDQGCNSESEVINNCAICDVSFYQSAPIGLNEFFWSGGAVIGWTPYTSSTKCQIKGNKTSLPYDVSIIVDGIGSQPPGAETIPASILQSGEEYRWKVRCGCSVNPLIASPFSEYRYFTFP